MCFAKERFLKICVQFLNRERVTQGGNKMNSRNVFITFVLVFSVKFATTEDEFPENPFETEYWKLYDLTEDKSGLESIRILHKQLDDDNDGAIEPSETCDFLRADLVKQILIVL